MHQSPLVLVQLTNHKEAGSDQALLSQLSQWTDCIMYKILKNFEILSKIHYHKIKEYLKLSEKIDTIFSIVVSIFCA